MLERGRSRILLAGDVPPLIAGGIRSPTELESLEAAAAEQLMTAFDGRFVFRDFWRALRPSTAKASSADSLFLAPNELGANSFRRSIKRHHKELARENPDISAGSSRMRPPENYPNTGPMARIKAIRDSR